MSGIELNKIVASILLASLIAMITGIVANILYKPNLTPERRGYSVEVSETSIHQQEVIESQIDIAELMKNANAEAGKDVAKKCLSCHSLEKEGPNRIGPHLWGVAGKEKGKTQDYKYSAALEAKGGVWDDESLFHFLQKPSKFLPGTKMSFAGIAKQEEVANLIAFLKKFVHD